MPNNRLYNILLVQTREGKLSIRLQKNSETREGKLSIRLQKSSRTRECKSSIQLRFSLFHWQRGGTILLASLILVEKSGGTRSC